MKKFAFVAAAAIALLATSCGSLPTYRSHTAHFQNVATEITSTNVADLSVGDRVSLRYTPTAEERRAGHDSCKAGAIKALLKANGNADIIVSPEYTWVSDNTEIEVSGRPAKYVNFRGKN